MPLLRSYSNSNPCSLLRLTLMLSSCVMTAMSMSYFALDMRTPKKCIVVDYAGTNFEVMYEVFDPSKVRMDSGVKMPESLATQGPIEIEIFPPDDSTIPRTPTNHLTKKVSDMEGKIEYSTEGTGVIHICTQVEEIPGRKYPRPTLLGLRVVEKADFDQIVGLAQEKSKENAKGQEAARKHFTEMERVLMNMIKETNILLKNADDIKSQESKFHKKSLDMNSASRWWPMLHVLVLLATGFTQANHMIKFFKSMHII